MEVSTKVSEIAESVTLKLNAKAVKLAESGKTVYNLTAGQLPFMPMSEFVELLHKQTQELKSYQYSPAAGFPNLREAIVKNIARTRDIDFSVVKEGVDAIVSNGAKHSLYNVLTALLNPSDEVILLAPYWISYTEMIKLCGGKPVFVNTSMDEQFVPDLAKIKAAITPKTKAIMVNSPNNPSGTFYPKKWMEELADILIENPHVNLISDEIYYELSYSGEKPTFPYQFKPELLDRTIIIDGISKTLACTGLRLGYIVAPKSLTVPVSKLQGQTASGSNSLIQRTLFDLGLDKSEAFLSPINKHLSENSQLVKEKLEEYGLDDCWYPSSAAFYYMVDFSKAPAFSRFDDGKGTDFAAKICEEVLIDHGVAMVPGTDFGMPNSGRISLVLDRAPFSKALDILFKYLSK